MKQFSAYTFTGKVTISEEAILDKVYRPLSKLEHQRVSFTPLFEETYFQQVGNFQVAKILLETRKEPDSNVLRDKVIERLQENPTHDPEVVEEETYLELKLLAGTKLQSTMVFVDNTLGKMLLSCTRKLADEVMEDLLSALEGDYEELTLIKSEAVIGEKLLTQWVSSDKPLEPFCLGETTHLGKRSELDKSPKNANIKIDKVYANDEEVLQHVGNGNVVKLLMLEFDGCCDLLLTSDMFIKGVKFKESAAFKEDEDTSESVNFMTQYQLQLPLIFDIVNSLEKAFSETTI